MIEKGRWNNDKSTINKIRYRGYKINKTPKITESKKTVPFVRR